MREGKRTFGKPVLYLVLAACLLAVAGIGRPVYASDISRGRVRLSLDTSKIHLQTGYREGQVQDIFEDLAGTSTTGVWIDTGNCFLLYLYGNTEWYGIGMGDSMIDRDRTYAVMIGLGLDNGYKWTDAIRSCPSYSVPLSKYPGFEVVFNGKVMDPNRTWIALSTDQKMLRVTIPVGRPAVTSVAKAAVTGIADKTYTGSSITQSPVVKIAGNTLTKGTDYTLAYRNNKNVGKATVTITGKGQFTGTLKKEFIIKPKKTTIRYVESRKNGFAVCWNRVTEQADGYLVRYSTDSSIRKNLRSKWVSGNTKNFMSFTNLPAKTKYYVHVAVYKCRDGVKYYSDWSPTKAVVTK